MKLMTLLNTNKWFILVSLQKAKANKTHPMEKTPQDNSVMMHIKELTEREEHLYGKADLTEDDIKDMHKVKSELDQYWDLLRQRRAFRDAGDDPNRAKMRSNDTIKNYKE
jgi:hypothetical protein